MFIKLVAGSLIGIMIVIVWMIGAILGHLRVVCSGMERVVKFLEEESNG